MITLIKTQKRENGWIRYWFKDSEGYEFFVQKSDEERIKKIIKNPNHLVGKRYQQEGLKWEARNREVIDSSPQQVAEVWYNNIYKKGGIPEPISDLVKEEWDREDFLVRENERLRQEKEQAEKNSQNQLKELTTIIFPIDSNTDNISFDDLTIQAEENNKEWEEEIEHAEVMDNWYQRLLKEEVSNRELVEKENERLKRRVEELEARMVVSVDR